MGRIVLIFILFSYLFYACVEQPSAQKVRTGIIPENQPSTITTDEPIAEFVRIIHKDSQGNMWFATNGKGVARYDGDTLQFFSIGERFNGTQVTDIMEASDGKVWFTTNYGVTIFDGNTFVNYFGADGLPDEWCWTIFQDSKGKIWVGTLEGVCYFDNGKFKPLELPPTRVENPEFNLSENRISSFLEDTDGNLWIATSAKGVYKYNGSSFHNFTKEDGLADNNMTTIIQGANGDIWIGSMNGGLTRYDGSTFTIYGDDVLRNNEVWTVYEDQSENIWFSSEGHGIYRINPTLDISDTNFLINYGTEQGLSSGAVQCIYQDEDHRMWIGGHGGLFYMENNQFFPVYRHGPWP